MIDIVLKIISYCFKPSGLCWANLGPIQPKLLGNVHMRMNNNGIWQSAKQLCYKMLVYHILITEWTDERTYCITCHDIVHLHGNIT